MFLILNVRVLCLQIWNHPDVLYEALQKENLANEQDLDLDDITTNHTRCPAPNQKSKPSEMASSVGGLSLSALQEKANQVMSYEWVSLLSLTYLQTCSVYVYSIISDYMLTCSVIHSVSNAGYASVHK